MIEKLGHFITVQGTFHSHLLDLPWFGTVLGKLEIMSDFVESWFASKALVQNSFTAGPIYSNYFTIGPQLFFLPQPKSWMTERFFRDFKADLMQKGQRQLMFISSASIDEWQQWDGGGHLEMLSVGS